MASGDTKTESYLRAAAEGTRADLPSDTCCNTKTQNLILGVANRIMDVEDEVEELKNNPDVVDIVATYQDLEDYDKSSLTDKDIIRVLSDSTHGGDGSYYRYDSTTQAFDYVGSAGGGGGDGGITELTTADYNYPTANPTGVAIWLLPTGIYKTKDNVSLFYSSNTSANTQASLITVNHENQYPSAVVYNWGSVQGLRAGGLALGYSNESGNLAGTAYNNIISSDGLKQTTGASTIDVMSQNAVTSMVFRDPLSSRQVQIGAGSQGSGNDGVAIGRNSQATQSDAVAIGSSSTASSLYSTVIGTHATSNNKLYSVALGSYSTASRKGEVNIGTGNNNYGYNDTSYRVLGGVHDGQLAQDAATVSQVNATIDAINTALSTSIPHIGA